MRSLPLEGADPDLVCLEVNDLVEYLGHHLTLSGIQRVQANLLRHVLRDAAGSGQCAAVLSRAAEGTFLRLDSGTVRRLVEYCTGHELERGRMDALLRDVERGAVPVVPSAGQCYVILGGFWTYRGMDRYLRLRDAGVSVGAYVYDLIPLSHPEFCDAGLVRSFALALGDGLAIFDFVLAISEASARQVRKYVGDHGLRAIPVVAVQLAHVLTDEGLRERPLGQDTEQEGKEAGQGGWTGRLAALRRRPFVLVVSTIEARKNHAYLVAAWKLLLQEGTDVPDLVFVGRQGWCVDVLMEELRRSRYLDGRVHVLHDLTDAELAVLYRHCLYTAFPSFVEGWGLPVGESLAHGAPCVASNTSSMPEVGGALVDYVDPWNLRNGVEVFRRMNADAAHRESRRAAIRAGFVPRTWDAVAQEFLRCVARLRGRTAHGPGILPRPAPLRAPAAPVLLAGEVFRPGDLHADRPAPPNYAARPLRLALYDGWRPIEGSGAWMRGHEAVLRFAAPYEAGTEVVLHLRFQGAPRADGVVLDLSTSTGRHGTRVGPSDGAPSAPQPNVTVAVRRDGQSSTRLLARVGEGGVVEVRLAVGGDIPPSGDGDGPRPAVGLVALAYAPRADAVLRADLADAFADP